MITNEKALAIYQSKEILRGLSGFKLARAIVLNMKKIEDELISVIKEQTKDVKDEKKINSIVEEALSKKCEINFITIDDEEIPGDVTVEQYSILVNFLKE